MMILVRLWLRLPRQTKSTFALLRLSLLRCRSHIFVFYSYLNYIPFSMFVYFFFFTSFNDSVLFLFECNSISGSHWKTKTKPFSRGVEKKQYVIIIIIWNNEISMITKEVQKKTRPMHGMHSMQWSERKIIISGYRRRNDMERSFNSNMHTTCSLFFPFFRSLSLLRSPCRLHIIHTYCYRRCVWSWTLLQPATTNNGKTARKTEG